MPEHGKHEIYELLILQKAWCTVLFHLAGSYCAEYEGNGLFLSYSKMIFFTRL